MMEKCGCCNGLGKVYIVGLVTGPNRVEMCSNCGGTGFIWNFGTFAITFKRSDELPKVKWPWDR